MFKKDIMKTRKIALIASVLILPSQQLLAANSNQRVVQSTSTKATIVMPIQKVLLNKAVKPIVAGKPKVMVSGNTVSAPNSQGFRLNKIQLSSNQRLLLTNGKSIVKKGSNGLNIIGVNRAVQSSYKNASLLKDNKKSVWIRVKGKQSKVGVFARVERSNINPLLGMKSTLNLGKLPHNKVLGVSTTRPEKTNSNVTLHNYEQTTENVQESPGGSSSNIRHTKTNARIFEADPTLKKFRWFNVTSDSVVATAIVVIDKNHRTIFINWGDGEVEVFNPFSVRLTVGNNEHVTNQSDAFKFRHVYTELFEPTKKNVTVSAKNSSGNLIAVSTKIVKINPRYKFSLYSLILEFPDHLDSSFESESEVEAHMTVKQRGDVLYDRHWKKSILTAPNTNNSPEQKIIWKLPGSHFSREIANLDEKFEIDLHLDEIDGVGKSSRALEIAWGVITSPLRAVQHTYEVLSSTTEFDGSNVLNRSGLPLKIHPGTTIGSNNADKATVVYGVGTKEGNIYAHFSYDLTLIVPKNPASSSMPMNSMN